MAEPRRTGVSQCGTYGGYQAHYRRGTKPCPDCTHAQTVYVGQWRARSGRTKNAKVPYTVLGALLESAPAEVEEWAEQQLGDAVVTNALDQWDKTRSSAVEDGVA